MKQSPFLLAAIAVASIILAGLFYWRNNNSSVQQLDAIIPANQEFQKTTISSLVNNIDQYDGKQVEVEGRFMITPTRPMPMCGPQDRNPNPKRIDEYTPINSLWQVTDGNTELGVVVVDAEGAAVNLVPNYPDDQQINLKATARRASVEKPCDPDRIYTSMYLEISAAEVNVTPKPSPKSLPESAP